MAWNLVKPTDNFTYR